MVVVAASASMPTRATTPSSPELAASPASTASAAAAASAPEAEWRALNRRASQQAKAGDFAGLRETLVLLAPAMPGSPRIAYKRAAAEARLGHGDEAIAGLTRLADAGLAEDPAADADFASLAERADFRRLRDRMADNRRPVGASTTWRALAQPDMLPEALAWDAQGKRLFVSSVRHCEVRVIDDPRARPADAKSERRFARLPASAFALGIDAARKRLWVTIATVAQAQGCGEGPVSAEATALLALDLDSGKLLQRVDADLPGVLGDLLVAEDGTVFVSESQHGAVLRLRPGAARLERLDVPGEFVSPQAPALSADHRALVVPDYARGMAVLALDACPCRPRWPANGPGVFTAGIDGLVRDGDTWVAVQNGTTPARLVRFSGDLSRQRVLESGTPGFGEPTHAIVVEGALWYIADVGWDRLDESGATKPGAPASHPELRVLPLPGR